MTDVRSAPSTHRIPFPTLLSAAAVAFALVLTGCEAAEDEPGVLEDDTTTDVLGQDGQRAAGPADTLGGAADTVEVGLEGRTIEMPERLAPGAVTFLVRNTGTEEHGFEVEGQGEEHVVESVAPGDSAFLQVDLEPGSYEVYCPVADHAEEGMRMELTVGETG